MPEDKIPMERIIAEFGSFVDSEYEVYMTRFMDTSVREELDALMALSDPDLQTEAVEMD